MYGVEFDQIENLGFKLIQHNKVRIKIVLYFFFF